MDLSGLIASLTSPDWEQVGTSAGGHAIVARRFAQATGGAPIFIYGAIHGNEPLGSFLLSRLADELADDESRLPRPLLILPVLNPDGFLLGQKNNHHDVDLNRNFPASNWNAETKRPGEFPGASPGSEPETQLLCALIDNLETDCQNPCGTRLVAVHSPFRTVNYDGRGQQIAERMAEQNGYGASADIGYPTPGSFGTMFGRDRDHEVVTLEIPPQSIDSAWQENRTALRVAAGL